MLKGESDSDWRDGFLFVGNHPALDFLNTRPLLSGDEPTELLPDFAAVLRWFRAANMLGSREENELRRQWGESEPWKVWSDHVVTLCEGWDQVAKHVR